MPAMAVPLAADKLGAWESWVGELKGPRKAAFDDMNDRLGLTEHRAYLQPTPDGNFLVVVVQEGPGSDRFTANVIASDHEFDRVVRGDDRRRAWGRPGWPAPGAHPLPLAPATVEIDTRAGRVARGRWASHGDRL
jgi:hypothetical protein